MVDWEEEDFEPAPPGLIINQPKSQRDDEDVEDENVKESWEDEEDPMQAPKPEQAVQKTPPKRGCKGAGKIEKIPEAKTSEIANEVLADPVAEKLRQQRLVEEADYKSTAELFAKKGDEKTLDNFIPKSESDFLEYAELLSHKILPYEKSFHYIGLLKAVMRFSMTTLKAANAKEISASVTAIANEKLKAEKEVNCGKKKQGTKKRQLHVERGGHDEDVASGYDDMDDYDFVRAEVEAMRYTSMARSSPHFVKVFLPEVTSQYLKIPPAFRAHLRSESLGMVSLRGPSGNVWDVELVDSSKNLQFESGWKEFVADHAVETGDFLVFQLDGCSCFSVLVFDGTACEKDVAFFARPCCGHVANVDELTCGDEVAVVARPQQQDIGIAIDVKEEEVNDSKAPVLASIDVPVVEKKRKMRNINCLATEGPPLEEAFNNLKSKRLKTSSGGKKGKQTGEVTLPSSTNKAQRDDKLPELKSLLKDSISSIRYISIMNKAKSNPLSGHVTKTSPRSQSSTTQSLSKKLCDFSPSKQSNELSECLRLLKSSEVRRRGEVVAKVQKMPALVSQRRPVTKEEVDEALHKAKSFKSKNPFFQVVMHDSYVYSGFFMGVPYSFARLHLPKISHRITLLDENEKSWAVSYVYCGYRGGLSGGWGAFTFAHNLEKYDVCIFELVKKNHLKVHVFRAVNKITPLICNFEGKN